MEYKKRLEEGFAVELSTPLAARFPKVLKSWGCI